MRHFLSATDAGDIDELIRKAIRIKQNPLGNKGGDGKHLGLIFMNPSMRTRISTQIAAENLGMDVIVLNAGSDSWQLEFNDGIVMDGKTAEHVKEAARVLGQYFDILGVRSFPSLVNKEDDYADKIVNAFKKYAGIPIISLESATLHPLQSLADAMTISENSTHLPGRPKVVLMWAPHIKPLPQSVPNSFAEWMTAWTSVEFVIAHPHGYELDTQFTGETPLIYNQEEAIKDADFIYVKNWSSVSSYGQILPVEGDWKLSLQKLKASNSARIMHCLPVRRNVVLDDEILDSECSLVTEEAGNRVWAAQAVISEILSGL